MITKHELAKAPELFIEKWFNVSGELTLKKLLGKPVYIHAFQMLCPGCVAHGIPQSQKVQRIFEKSDLQVVGLHTVFEHHNAMTPASLKAFLHEYKVTFPVGVDQHVGNSDMPLTMAAYTMRGTPTTILINRSGKIAANIFGQIDDLALGAMIQSLLEDTTTSTASTDPDIERCNDDGCPIPVD